MTSPAENSSQLARTIIDGKLETLTLPAPEAELLGGVPWGHFDVLFTPAFWRVQAWQHIPMGNYSHHSFGETLAEEAAACLLGGYGMPAEHGLIAFEHLRRRGLLQGIPTQAALFEALLEPLSSSPRLVSYRFPRQKSQYLAATLALVHGIHEPTDDVQLRDVLVALPGIGPKTASWIVRNYRGSNHVAILDVHVVTAGRLAGIFGSHDKLPRDYLALERRFLDFAQALQVPASLLDGMIWDYMRRIRPALRRTRKLRVGASNGQLPLPSY